MTNLFGRTKFYSLFLAAALLLAGGPAFAEKRVALVIGNAAYQNVPRLPNPVNDGNTIASTLKDAGFDVVDNRHDMSAADIRRALRDFADRARDADIAVVYYAGHGIEVDGGNYLIPVDAKLERDTDVYDEALSLDRVLLAVEPDDRGRPWIRSLLEPERTDLPAVSIAHTEGVAVARRAQDWLPLLTLLYDLALARQAQGDLAGAAGRLQEGLALAAEAGDETTAAYYLEVLAAVAGQQHNPQRAVRLFAAARSILDASGSGWLVTGA